MDLRFFRGLYSLELLPELHKIAPTWEGYLPLFEHHLQKNSAYERMAACAALSAFIDEAPQYASQVSGMVCDALIYLAGTVGAADLALKIAKQTPAQAKKLSLSLLYAMEHDSKYDYRFECAEASQQGLSLMQKFTIGNFISAATEEAWQAAPKMAVLVPSHAGAFAILFTHHLEDQIDISTYNHFSEHKCAVKYAADMIPHAPARYAFNIQTLLSRLARSDHPDNRVVRENAVTSLKAIRAASPKL